METLHRGRSCRGDTRVDHRIGRAGLAWCWNEVARCCHPERSEGSRPWQPVTRRSRSNASRVGPRYSSYFTCDSPVGGALALEALMVDVDGVLVDGRPEDGRHWLTSVHDDLGFTAETLHQHFFARHWDEIVIDRADLTAHLTTCLGTNAPEVSPAQLISYWFERDSRVATPLHEQLAVAQTTNNRVYLATNQEHLRAAYLMERLGL